MPQVLLVSTGAIALYLSSHPADTFLLNYSSLGQCTLFVRLQTSELSRSEETFTFFRANPEEVRGLRSYRFNRLHFCKLWALV